MDGSRPAGPPLRPAIRGGALPPPSGPPAGWYPDPFGARTQRFFDGRGWTEHVAWTTPPVVGPHPTLPLQAAIGALVVLAASLVASRLVIANTLRFDLPLVAYVAISVAIGYGPSVWWCLVATRRWGTGDRRTDLGLRFRWSDLGWGPVVWLAALGGQIVMVLVVTLFRIPYGGNIDEVGDLDRTYVIAQAIAAVVAAPIVEEIVFRAVVLRGFLSRMRWVPAVILQGLLFGAAHIGGTDGAGNIGLALILGGVGVVFGGAAYLLRRIGPTILGHAIFNAVVLVVVLTTDLPRR